MLNVFKRNLITKCTTVSEKHVPQKVPQKVPEKVFVWNCTHILICSWAKMDLNLWVSEKVPVVKMFWKLIQSYWVLEKVPAVEICSKIVTFFGGNIVPISPVSSCKTETSLKCLSSWKSYSWKHVNVSGLKSYCSWSIFGGKSLKIIVVFKRFLWRKQAKSWSSGKGEKNI